MAKTLPLVAPHPLEPFIQRLLRADALLPDSKTNVLEVVGILKSYGVVLDAYSKNLIYRVLHESHALARRRQDGSLFR